ncbi:MAG: C25 family cysteine peptidase [Candidatus Eisenbacteria bacterium]
MSASPRIGELRSERKGAGRALLFVALLVALPLGAVAATTTDDVVAVFEFDLEQLSYDVHDGYDVVTLEGTEFMAEPTEPMLPALNVQLLLPPGVSPVSVTARAEGTVAVPGTFTILPAPRPARLSSPEAAEDPQPNVTTYDSVLPYPREVARLAGVGTTRGYRVASVRVVPLSYVPAAGELRLHRRIEIVVSTEPDHGAEVSADGRVGAARSAVERSVVNPDGVDAYEASSAARRGERNAIEYLVICPDALAVEFERLAEWKTRKGVPAAVVTLEEIDAEPLFAGVDQAERIRNCVAHHASTSGVEWVLLGGDTDVLPTREAYDFFYDQGLPCDLYYADLDGSWDEDGDGLWGEVDDDDVDMYSDVFVGRAPVTTVAGAASFVDKVLEYEGASFALSTDYQLRMLYLGEVLWDSPDPYTDGAIACEMIDDGYVPARFDPATKLYESATSLDLSAAVAELEAGCGLIMHEGHANVSRVSIGPDNLTNATLDGLTNGSEGGVWYSVGCWSAAIDQDTFGEHWITNPLGGGVAYVGNSRYGWGCPGYPGQCVSDLYSQQYYNSLFVKDLVNAGAVHADAKHHYVGLAKIDDYMRYAMYELNLLGDPEMPVWTDTPRQLDVSCQTSLDAARGVVDVSVTVNRQGAPVQGATVCLSDAASGVYEVGRTDAAGAVTLTVDAGVAGYADLTVTARNSIPHGESLPLGDETGIDDEAVERVTTLMQNYPNPFNPSTSIAFSLARSTNVSVSVYDVSGRLVTVLVDEEVDAGPHAVEWDGRDARGNDVASGTYFARMNAAGKHFETKMIVMR